jgi:hypothetical protein
LWRLFDQRLELGYPAKRSRRLSMHKLRLHLLRRAAYGIGFRVTRHPGTGAVE